MDYASDAIWKSSGIESRNIDGMKPELHGDQVRQAMNLSSNAVCSFQVISPFFFGVA
jgi:hypothetical protein